MLLLKNYSKLLLIAFFTTVLVISCGKDNETPIVAVLSVKNYDYKVAYDWNQLFLETELHSTHYL